MRVTRFDGTTASTAEVSELKDVPASDTGFQWIDVLADGPSDPGVAALFAELGLGQAQLTYLRRENVAGLFAVANGHILVSTWVADNADPSTPGVAEVHLMWTPDWMMTLRFSGDAAIDHVRQRLSRADVFAHPPSALGIVLQMMLATVDQELIGYSEQLDTLDGQIIEDPHPGYMGQVRDLRGVIVPMARRYEPYAESVSQALIDPGALPGMDADGLSHLQAYSARLQDTVARIGDLSDGLRNCAQDFQTEVGNRQGNRINQLTIVSMVFLPISFLTGYFGMNFQWLDNELMSLATWILFGVVLPVAAVVVSIVLLGQGGYIRRRRQRRGTSAATSGADSD